MRGLVPAFLLLLGPLLAGCGADEGERSAEAWRKSGDSSFLAADELMVRAEAEPGTLLQVDSGALRAEAVRAYVEAANDLIRAFHLEDPLPARQAHRGMLAFRIGRALSSAARHGVTHPYRDRLAQRSLFWFGEALGLSPALSAAEFERAVLYDSEIPEVRDPYRAREGYGRFLQALGDEPGRSAAFERLHELALQRHAVLSKELDLGRDD